MDRRSADLSAVVKPGNLLSVEISDASANMDDVKFTVHTKTTLPMFEKSEFSVVRQHIDFVSLHNSYVESVGYLGFLIPPAPPKPNMAPSEMLEKLEDDEAISREAYYKLKLERDLEHIATFKKTVAMHEVFLCRLANHPIFRTNPNLKVFLEQDPDICLQTLWPTVPNVTDDMLKSFTPTDDSSFFEQEKSSLLQYLEVLREALSGAEGLVKSHKNMAYRYLLFSTSPNQLAIADESFEKLSETMETAAKIESSLTSDVDLNLTETLQYWLMESNAAKDLLYRRLRSFANYQDAITHVEITETANQIAQVVPRTLQILPLQATVTERNFQMALLSRQNALETFERVSEKAKEELTDFKSRRSKTILKNLVELLELKLKHAEAKRKLFSDYLTAYEEETELEADTC